MKGIESLYQKLFSIPRAEIMVAVSFLSALMLSLLDEILLYFWALLFAVSIVGVRVINLKFDLKRISFLAFLITVITLPAVLVNGSVTASAFLLFLVYYFCSEKKFLSIPLASVPYLVLSPNISTLLILLISAIFVVIYLKMLDVKVGVVRIKDFVENFVLYWLTSNPEYMEKFLETSAEEFEGRVRCLTINNARVIQTDFHPGPFRNVGGARLVEKLSAGNSVYLHSPTSHARNPVSFGEVEKIASRLRCSGKNLIPQKPFRIESSNFEVYCFPFSEQRVIFVSGKKHIDDFIVNSKSFVVDCHNAFEEGYDPDSRDVEKIQSLVKEAEKITSQPAEVKSAFVRIDAETESLCGYVATILLDYSGEKYAIVVFDANNVDLEFRRHVENLFDEIGYRAIVVSTDNHAKTGVRAKLAYKPAGGDSKDWEIAKKLVEKCRNAELKETVFSYFEDRARIKVMGERLLRDSEVAVEKKARELIAIFLAFVATNYLLSTMLRFIA